MYRISRIGKKDLGQVLDLVPGTLSSLSQSVQVENWSPCLFSGQRRLESEFVGADLAVLDVDSGMTLEQAQEITRDFSIAILTSRNHQKDKRGVTADRFRMIIPLESRITGLKDYRATMQALRARFPAADPQCLDGARLFFPSPGLIVCREEGKKWPITAYKPDSEALAPGMQPVPGHAQEGPKGRLWRSTLEFLTFGAPAGSRHAALVKAVGNMREQGYLQEETLSMVGAMALAPGSSWTQPGLNSDDIRTVDRMYKRNPKYEFVEDFRDRKGVGRVHPSSTLDGFASDSKRADAGDSYVSAVSLLEESFEYLQDKDKVKGEPTGIEGLDKLLGGGFRTGELTVLMAQAKTGKNTFYHYLIYSYLKRGVPFGYASRELSPATEVLPNFLSIDTGSNIWKQERYSDEFKKMVHGTVTNWPLYFAPGYGYFDPEDLESWFKDMKAAGVNHFLFDHLHYALMQEDYESTTALIKKLKSLTKELDIHLNLIVQPRSLREGEKLSLATLRGGAAIGQALDNLLILERVRGQDNISRLSLEVARHKLCKLGDIYLRYDQESTRFEEVEKKTEDAEEENADLNRRMSYRVN